VQEGEVQRLSLEALAAERAEAQRVADARAAQRAGRAAHMGQKQEAVSLMRRVRAPPPPLLLPLPMSLLYTPSVDNS
jgi:hypothetical protein